jgi:hypothetical protein
VFLPRKTSLLQRRLRHQRQRQPLLLYLRPNATTAVSPVFKWSAVESAEQYELLVSRDDAFLNLVIDKSGANACNANVWESNVSLEFNTGYYWRVRAVRGQDYGEWSDVSLFRTKAESTPTSPSGGSAGGETTKKPSPTLKPTPVPSPTATPSPKITPVASPSQTPEGKVAEAPVSLSPTISPSIASNQGVKSSFAYSAAPSSSVAPISNSARSPSSPVSSDSTARLLFFLIGGLVVLTIILTIVVVFMLKKFKKM